MAAVKDSYTLELLDKILAPLKRIEAQAEKVGGVMERLEKMCSSGLGLAKLAGYAAGAVAGLGLLGSAVSGVIGLMERAAHGAWEFGKSVVEAARFAQASKLSFDIFLGKGQGEGVFNRTLQAGNLLPIDERDLVRNAQALAGSGYSGHRLDAANAALSDIEALRGKFYSQNLLLHLQRLQNEARPQARDVNMAAIDAGTGLGGIYKQLYKQQGMAMPKDPDSEEGLHVMTKQYEHWVKQGKIGGKSVADAIMAAIEERFDEGKGLGTAAVKLGVGTLGGLLSNLEAAPQRFLMQLGVERFEGIKALMRFLQRILEYFNLATPQGKALGAAVEKLVNTLLGGLDRFGPADLEAFFQRGLKAAERLSEIIAGAWESLDKLLQGKWAEALAPLAGMFVGIGQLIGQGILEGIWGGAKAKKPIGETTGNSATDSMSKISFWGMAGDVALKAPATAAKFLWQAPGALASGFGALGDSKIWSSAADSFRKVGEGLHLVDPKEGGDKEAVAEVRESGRNIFRGAKEGIDEEGQIHSPSRVTYEQGRSLVQGFVDGIRDKMADLEPGGADDFIDELMGALRGSVARSGMAPA